MNSYSISSLMMLCEQLVQLQNSHSKISTFSISICLPVAGILFGFVPMSQFFSMILRGLNYSREGEFKVLRQQYLVLSGSAYDHIHSPAVPCITNHFYLGF